MGHPFYALVMAREEKMEHHEVYAAAWRKMAEIIQSVDMDEYEENDKVIDAMYELAQSFESQATGIEADHALVTGVHGNLVAP